MLKIFLLCKIEYKIFDMKYNVHIVYVYSYRLTKNSFSIFDIRDPDFNFFQDKEIEGPEHLFYLSIRPSVCLSRLQTADQKK